MSPNFAKLFEESLKRFEAEQGSIVKGTVIEINNGTVLIDAGLKSKSAIPAEQFKNSCGELEVNVGDEVDVALDAIEGGFGETILSREKAKRYEAWQMLEKAYEQKETVVGIINGRVKGGFTVEVNTIRAFLPTSLVDIRPLNDTTHIEGKELEFKVIKFDQKRNNVVVLRSAVIESETSLKRKQLLESLQEGQEIKGIVKNLTEFGAFIDLGGIDGLLHKSEMNFEFKGQNTSPETLAKGQNIDVTVLAYDRQKTRISLTTKSPEQIHWIRTKEKFEVGHEVVGRVITIQGNCCVLRLNESAKGRFTILNDATYIEGEAVKAYIFGFDDSECLVELTLKNRATMSFSDIAEML